MAQCSTSPTLHPVPDSSTAQVVLLERCLFCAEVIEPEATDALRTSALRLSDMRVWAGQVHERCYVAALHPDMRVGVEA
jgi:hypothetical protein